ncbi:maleylpyruvate isomerase family mycothiol-dependent enzyme [Dermatophilaceae bacterium Soc4.6]
MPAHLDLDSYGDAIGAAATVLRENARLAGADAAVPGCPGWTVSDLVLHTGLVHRWTASILRGSAPVDAGTIEVPAPQSVRDECGFTGADPYDWYDEQVKAMLQTIVDTPVDAQVFFFLKDAPAPRMAWTRRQAHETTVHGVDAMSARLGRLPRVGEVWVRPPLAVDGLDELLSGFVPRRTQRLRSTTPYALLVETSDTGHGWLLEVSGEPVVTTALAPGDERPSYDVRLVADAVPLYLHLWNREPTDSPLECSDPEVLAQWRAQLRIL